MHLQEAILTRYEVGGPILKLSIEGDGVSTELIQSIWKDCFPLQAMPKIIAFNVNKDEYIRIRRQVHDFNIKQGEDPDTGEMLEYGRPLYDYEGTAATLSLESGEFLILRRKDSWISEESDLIHELIHIESWELIRGR